jgi:putative PEP-CTERM system TPR-repeat lipoprotein
MGASASDSWQAALERIALSALIVLSIAGCGRDPAATLQHALQLEAKRDYATAIAVVAQAARDAPEDARLRYQLGRLKGLSFDTLEAEHDLRKALDLGAVEGGRVVLELGRVLLQQRKYAEVATAVVPASVFEPNVLASVHAVRGSAFLTLGRFEEAKGELHAARAIEPGNVDVLLLQARFRGAMHDVKGAMSYLETALKANPRNADAWLQQAELLAAEGDLAPALAAIDKALEARPGHLKALSARATMLIVQDRLAEALKDVDILRRQYPKHARTLHLRGLLHYWRNELRETLDLAQAALKTDERDSVARLLSALANLRAGTPASAEYELAQYLSQSPRSMHARALWDELHSRPGPRDQSAKFIASIRISDLRRACLESLLGEAYLPVWQYSKVAQWLEQLARSGLPDPLAGSRQAGKRFTREQLESAIADLERVAALRDEASSSDSALVIAYLALGDSGKALDAALAMRRKPGADAQAAMMSALVLANRGSHDEARRQFEAALHHDPKLVAAAVGLARLELAAGKRDMARRHFDNLLAADSDSLHGLLAYAHLEASLGRPAQARDLLHKAAALHPRAVEPHAVLASLLVKQNDKAGAVSVADAMLKAHPDDPLALEIAADVYSAVGQPEHAVKLLKQLVQRFPRSPESRFKLARAQMRSGQKEAAAANVRTAVGLPLDDPDRHRVEFALVVDDGSILEAIGSARKVLAKYPTVTAKSRLDGELWTIQMGARALAESASGESAAK